MLSIAQMKGPGQGDYYLELSREDYYLAGGEPPGIWYGTGAKEIGLSGEVTKKELKNLLSGYSPDGEKPLVKNAGKENRQSGWDLTFSAPKTVSVAWSQSEGEARKAIESAHREAVKTALQFLEKESSFTRRGAGGSEREEAKLIVAAFEHGTSRAQDPQLHTHALIVNTAIRVDGTTGTIESKPLYQSKMTAGAIYRAELSYRLETDPLLGLRAEKKKSWFELKGVSQELTGEFSKRRKEILEEIDKSGFQGAKAFKVATLNTRSVKEHVARDTLFSGWSEVGKEYGFSKEELAKLTREPLPERDIEKEKREAFTASVTRITQQESHFGRRDLIRHVAEEAQGRGIGASHVFKSIEENLNSPKIVSLGRVKGELRYTTKEMLELEERMLSKVEQGKEAVFRPVSEGTLQEVFSKRAGITEEQKNAVKHITGEKGGIKAVSGMAGTGKSYMLGAAKEALEKEGYTVTGAALSGKAARGLEEEAGIKSDTIHRTLSDIENGKISLNEKSVLIIDEAGMVGTRQMERLVTYSQNSGAKLVLVGDARQLQPVDAGGPFKAITEITGEAKLTEIRRQEETWAKDVVHQFAEGNAKAGLEEFLKRNQLHILDTPDEAKKALISDWEKKGVERPDQNLILAGTNLDAAILNEKAQVKRFSAGKLGEDSIASGSERIFSGDRILFTRNSRLYGVRNGQLGTVESVSLLKNSLTAKLDSGKKIQINLNEYEHIRLGYAVTTHKSQGMTAHSTYILAGGSMQDRELSYVQVSRAKEKTQIYTDKVEAGENLTALSRQMSKSRQKELSVSIAERPIRRAGL